MESLFVHFVLYTVWSHETEFQQSHISTPQVQIFKSFGSNPLHFISHQQCFDSLNQFVIILAHSFIICTARNYTNIIG